MKKWIILLLVLSGVLIFLAGCGDDELIGLERLEYNPDKAILQVHYFTSRNNADNYFESENVEDYFLFEMLHDERTTRETFDNFPGETLNDNTKEITFVDENNDAREKVVNLLIQNNMQRVYGPDQ